MIKSLFDNIKRITVVCGHFGSGKTEFSLNYALHLRRIGLKVTVIDFDIVNPYYRTKDAETLLKANGIEVISPEFANSNLETPTLPPDILSAFDDTSRYIIFDVGGDEDGATPLGAYYNRFSRENYDMFFVLNGRRMLTADAEGALSVLGDIEYVSRLRFTGIVNNTHLMQYTDKAVIDDGARLALEVSDKTGLPVICTCVERGLLSRTDLENENYEKVFPIDLYVGPNLENIN